MPLYSRSHKGIVSDPGVGALDLYLFFNIFPSHVALPLLIAMLCLAGARKNIVLLNMCINWIIVGLVSCILLYSGHQTGKEPPKMLCVAQASLLYAVPPMVSTSILALIFQAWNNIVWKPGEAVRGVLLACILMFPYIVFFLVALVGSTIGASSPGSVSRDRRFFYCSVQSNVFSTVVVLYAASMLIATTVFIVWTCLKLYQNSRILKNGHVSDKPSPKGSSADDAQFAVRVSIFGVYIFIGLALSFVSIVAPDSPVPDLIFASMGTAVFLVFGTQPKLWYTWVELYRRTTKPKEEVKSHVATLIPYPPAGDELKDLEGTPAPSDILTIPNSLGRSGKSPLPPGVFRSDVVGGDDSDGTQTLLVPPLDEKAAMRAHFYSPSTSSLSSFPQDSQPTRTQATAGPPPRPDEISPVETPPTVPPMTPGRRQHVMSPDTPHNSEYSTATDFIRAQGPRVRHHESAGTLAGLLAEPAHPPREADFDIAAEVPESVRMSTVSGSTRVGMGKTLPTRNTSF